MYENIRGRKYLEVLRLSEERRTVLTFPLK